MGILSKLFSGGVADLFKSVVEEFHLPPEKAAEIQLQLQTLQAQADQADKDLELKLNDIAGQNIRSDTSSGDAFVRRARPAFLWIMTLALGFNIFLPLVNHFFGGTMQPINIDSGLYGLFSSGYLGYTIARTYEKKTGTD